MNYYNPSKNQVFTRFLMDQMGLPQDDDALRELGYFPLEYNYVEYDALRQEMLPNGAPVLMADGKRYAQAFHAMPLDAARLADKLAGYKASALERLNAEWLKAEQSGRLQSSVGFAIDATERANRDISGLITDLEATGNTSTTFCAADNSMHEVTLEQLKTMRLEVIRYGQALYAKKWGFRTAIENAASFEEVDAVNISFAEAA